VRLRLKLQKAEEVIANRLRQLSFEHANPEALNDGRYRRERGQASSRLLITARRSVIVNPARFQTRTVSGLMMASRAPVVPGAGQADPQQAVGGGQFQAFCRRSLKHTDLVAQSQVLEVEGGTRSEDRAN